MARPFEITLRDSGYRETGNIGVETDKANSGTAVTITVGSSNQSGIYSITRSHKTLLGDDPQPQKFRSNISTNEFSIGFIDETGIDNPKWTIRGRLDMNLSADRTLFGNLCRMVRTKGVKILGTTADNDNPIMIRWTDETAVASVNTRIVAFDAEQESEQKHRVRYTLELVETA